MEDKRHPGFLLQEKRKEQGITLRELSGMTGIQYTHLHLIIKGKRGINPKIAVKLEEVFGTLAEYWLTAQMLYDLALARNEINQKTK